MENTAFDFLKESSVGSRIEDVAGGYDHNFVLDRTSPAVSSGGEQAGAECHLAARVRHAKSGRVMELLTSAPGVQFYSGNFLDGSFKGDSGKWRWIPSVDPQR